MIFLTGMLQRPTMRCVAAHVGVEFDRRPAPRRGCASTAACALALHLAAQRAGGRGQHDGEAHLAAVDVDVLDHPQGDQIVVQFRFLYRAQRRQYVLLAYVAVFLAKHVLVLEEVTRNE
ncbi:MAG: hypothetical protein V9E94_03305 [Microthrixaceae bacterium]